MEVGGPHWRSHLGLPRRVSKRGRAGPLLPDPLKEEERKKRRRRKEAETSCPVSAFQLADPHPRVPSHLD